MQLASVLGSADDHQSFSVLRLWRVRPGADRQPQPVSNRAAWEGRAKVSSDGVSLPLRSTVVGST
jgi:hypothetical protein